MLDELIGCHVRSFNSQKNKYEYGKILTFVFPQERATPVINDLGITMGNIYYSETAGVIRAVVAYNNGKILMPKFSMLEIEKNGKWRKPDTRKVLSTNDNVTV